MKKENNKINRPFVAYDLYGKPTELECDVKLFYGFYKLGDNCSIKRNKMKKLEVKLSYYLIQYRDASKLVKCLEGHLK